MKKLLESLRFNWQLLVLSIILALLLWVYVVSAEAPQMERVLSVPLKIRNLEEGLAVTQVPSSVSLRVRAPVRMEVRTEDIDAYLDLKGQSEGQWLLSVLLKPVPGASFVEVKPEKVLVTLEAIATKTMTVEVIYFGKLPQGFTLGPVQEIKPAEVEIKGPQSALERAQRVVAAIDLTGITSQISQTVAVRVLDEKGQDVPQVEVNPANVSVSVTVNVESVFKTVPVLPLLQGSLPFGLTVKRAFCDPPAVTIEGSADVLETVTSLYTYPVSLEGQEESFEEVTYLDVSGRNVRLISDSRVKVVVEVENEMRAQFEVVVRVKESAIPVSLKTSRVTVEVSGPESIIQSLSPQDFNAWVDASGLQKGTFSLPVKVDPPFGAVILRVEPAQIEVEVGE